MARTKEDTINEVTCAYLAQLDIKNLPSPEDIKADILDQMKSAFDLENTVKEKAEKWRIMDRLIPVQVAAITATLYPVISLDMTNGAGESSNANTSPLAIYQYDGENEGIYVVDEKNFENIGNQYCYGMNAYEQREYFRHLRRLAPRKQRCNNRDLVPVNNGIFDYRTKRLMPFSPEYIFTSKSRVNYNPLAQNVTIHNPDNGTDWDVESWMADLSDDPEIVNVLWQIMGAIIRPNVSWDKSAWFYSESGSNGKQYVTITYRHVGSIGAMHPQVANKIRTGSGNSAAAHNSSHHRNLGFLYHFGKNLICPGNIDAAACQKQRLLGFLKHL